MKKFIFALVIFLAGPVMAAHLVLDCPHIPYPDITAAQVFEDNGIYTLRQFHSGKYTDSHLNPAQWKNQSIKLANYKMALRRLEKSAGYWWVIVQEPAQTVIWRLDDCVESQD